MASLGQYIKALRQTRRLTQAELADSVGISTKTITAYELDHIVEHRIPVLINIANALGTDLNDFMQFLRESPLDVQEVRNRLCLVAEALNERNLVTLLSLAKSLRSQQKIPEQFNELKLEKQLKLERSQSKPAFISL